jgi:hypothetical protein
MLVNGTQRDCISTGAQLVRPESRQSSNFPLEYSVFARIHPTTNNTTTTASAISAPRRLEFSSLSPDMSVAADIFATVGRQ